MTSAIENKGLNQDYSGRHVGGDDIKADNRKGTPLTPEPQGKIIDRAEQLLARMQALQGRNADPKGEINKVAREVLGLGDEIRRGTPPSDQYLQSLKSQGVLSTGIVTMAAVMLLLQEHANATFSSMSERTTASRDAQEMANRVKAVLAKLTKPDDKGELPQDVIDYMRANNILVDGKTIDEFLPDEPSGMKATVQILNPDGTVKENKEVLNNPTKSNMLKQGDLKAVELALESASNRATDFVQQSQLKLQQLMQNYNTAVQMTNSLQSMLAESVKSIASSIR